MMVAPKSMKPPALITMDNVTVRLGGAWPLTNISWKIGQGENWVIWGANGAGKTTLAKVLLGEAHVVKGSVHRSDALQTPQRDLRNDIALVSSDQLFDLYRREQLLGQMRHFSGRMDEVTAAGEVLPPQFPGKQHPVGLLRLEPLLAKPLQALSAGEMRRLLIGRAMLRDPRLLILDEPFNGLDAETRDDLMLLLEGLAAAGTQMVLITHRPAEIGAAFTQLLHLDHGTVVWSGPVTAFKATPSSRSHASKRTCDAGKRQACAPDQLATLGDTPLIEMRDVNVSFGRHVVLSHINWTMHSGENWAIIGPNGAGKSTLLKLITGDTLQGYANDLILFGRPKGSGESVWEVKQQIGYVADDLQVRYQKKMRGFDVVCSGFFDSVGLYRLCSDPQIAVAQQWIERAGVTRLASRQFARLSFGQQRLLLILRAMVKTPRLLILDEPCNGLDAKHQRLLLNLLDIIGRSHTTNLLMVSHRSEEMPPCITHELHLSNGSVIEEGPK